MLAQQKGICLICKKIPTKRLAVDHNHKTEKVRGLLCIKCNSAIGFFQDDINLIKNAYKYLIKFS